MSALTTFNVILTACASCSWPVSSRWPATCARSSPPCACGRYPEPPVPEPVMGLILRMADAAVRAGQNTSRLVATRDLELAALIEAQDAELDALHRRSFTMILDPANDLTRQQVVDAVLMGRFLERFGDHSTSVARRVSYLVLGSLSR